MMEFQNFLNFLLKNMFLAKNFLILILSEIVVHMIAIAKLKTPSESEHSNARSDLLNLNSNKELHIRMQSKKKISRN